VRKQGEIMGLYFRKRGSLGLLNFNLSNSGGDFTARPSFITLAKRR